MRRDPLLTQYSVPALHLFGFVWWAQDDLDPSDHPLYLGPGPTRQPTPTAGVRKIAHDVKQKYGEGLREWRRKHRLNLSVLKQACWCFNPAFNRVQRSYTVPRHKGKFKNAVCFHLAPLRHAKLSHDWLIIFLHRTSTSEHDASSMAYLHLSSRVRAMFLQLQRKRRWRRERSQKEKSGNMCERVCVCVAGGGA